MRSWHYYTLGSIFIAAALSFGCVRLYKGIMYDIAIGDRLKRAADANTIELARTELTVVVDYLQKNNITSGYTSALYRTPDEDVGFWFRNLSASLTELNELSTNATPLERSNMLIKLRETLLDQEEKGTNVTAPRGISIYPDNKAYAVVGWIVLCLGVVGVILIIIGTDVY